MELWVNCKHSASISRGRVAVLMEIFPIAGFLARLVHRGIPFGPFTDSKDRDYHITLSSPIPNQKYF